MFYMCKVILQRFLTLLNGIIFTKAVTDITYTDTDI